MAVDGLGGNWPSCMGGGGGGAGETGGGSRGGGGRKGCACQQGRQGGAGSEGGHLSASILATIPTLLNVPVLVSLCCHSYALCECLLAVC